jgi:hypothetical protein
VRVVPGRRPIVVDVPVGPDHSPELVIERQIAAVLAPIVREARLLGLSPARVAKIASRAVRDFPRAPARRVYLFECNRVEAQQYAREIGERLGVTVEWKLLDDLPRTPVAPSDIFVVPYYHLDDVAPHLPAHQIAGIHVAPDPEVLFKLIEAAQAGRVALICGNPKSADRFRNLFQYYTSKGVRVAHHRDVPGMRALLANARTVFATPVAFRTVRQQIDASPIEFPERIDPQSLHSLRVLLAQTDPPTIPKTREAARR